MYYFFVKSLVALDTSQLRWIALDVLSCPHSHSVCNSSSLRVIADCFICYFYKFSYCHIYWQMLVSCTVLENNVTLTVYLYSCAYYLTFIYL